MTDGPAYHGDAMAVHVELLTEDPTTVPDGTPVTPTYSGQTVGIRTSDSSPEQFDLSTITGPIPFDAVYRGISPAIHVFGAGRKTRPPRDPIPSCLCCAEVDAIFDSFTRSVSPNEWGFSDAGLEWESSVIGTATGSVDGTQGVLTAGPDAGTNATIIERMFPGWGLPIDVYFNVEFQNIPGGSNGNTRFDFFWNESSGSGATFFLCQGVLEIGGSDIDFFAPAPTASSVSFTGQKRVRAQLDSVGLRLKYWDRSDPEPAPWTVYAVWSGSPPTETFLSYRLRQSSTTSTNLTALIDSITVVVDGVAIGGGPVRGDCNDCTPGCDPLTGTHTVIQSVSGTLDDDFARIIPYGTPGTPGPFGEWYQLGVADSGQQWWSVSSAGTGPVPIDTAELDGSSILVTARHINTLGGGVINAPSDGGYGYEYYDFGWVLADLGFDVTFELMFDKFMSTIIQSTNWNAFVKIATSDPTSHATASCTIRVRESTDLTQLFLSNGSTTTTFTLPTLTPNTLYKVRWQVLGPLGTSQARIWTGGVEPSTWDGAVILTAPMPPNASFGVSTSAGPGVVGGPPQLSRLDSVHLTPTNHDNYSSLCEDVVTQIGPRQYQLAHPYLPGTIVAFVERAGYPLVMYSRFQVSPNIVEDDPTTGLFSFPASIDYSPAYNPLITSGTTVSACYISPNSVECGHEVNCPECDECEDPDNPGFQLPQFTPGFMPTFRRQIGDPTTALDSFICTFESGAMVLDWHTRGAVSVWGGELIPWSGRTESSIIGSGGNLGDIRQAWRHYDSVLSMRSGQTWDDLYACLLEGRAVILQGDYGEFTLAVRCQDSFEGGHAISVYPYQVSDRLLVGDPLCSDFHGVKISQLQAYAEALGAVIYGAQSPQPILFAVSRPWTP